jgi:hypothetical protein
MTVVTFLKSGTCGIPDKGTDLPETVVAMLAEVEAGGEAVAWSLSHEFDRFEGKIVVSDRVPQQL